MSQLVSSWVFTGDFSQAEHQAITSRVLAGASYAQVGVAYGMSASQIRTIVHRVCLHTNADLYCETVKAAVRQRPWGGGLACYEPSLAFLRQHRSAFGSPVNEAASCLTP